MFSFWFILALSLLFFDGGYVSQCQDLFLYLLLLKTLVQVDVLQLISSHSER